MRIGKNTSVEQAGLVTPKEKLAVAQKIRQSLEGIAGIGFEIAHVDKVRLFEQFVSRGVLELQG